MLKKFIAKRALKKLVRKVDTTNLERAAKRFVREASHELNRISKRVPVKISIR